jgi:hypothetical protein
MAYYWTARVVEQSSLPGVVYRSEITLLQGKPVTKCFTMFMFYKAKEMEDYM